MRYQRVYSKIFALFVLSPESHYSVFQLYKLFCHNWRMQKLFCRAPSQSYWKRQKATHPEQEYHFENSLQQINQGREEMVGHKGWSPDYYLHSSTDRCSISLSFLWSRESRNCSRNRFWCKLGLVEMIQLSLSFLQIPRIFFTCNGGLAVGCYDLVLFKWSSCIRFWCVKM